MKRSVMLASWPNWPAMLKRPGPFRRAARWDGVCPGGLDRPLTPGDWRDILAYIRAHRTGDVPFEAVHGGRTPGDDPAQAAAIVAQYAEAGVTWWIEDLSPYGFGLGWGDSWTPAVVEQIKERLWQGPPAIQK